MGAINRVPLGFLGLFDAKVEGRNPAQFSDFISPTVDLTNFYSFSRGYAVESATQAAGVAVGLRAQVDVPEGKLWLVYGIHAQVIAAVAGLTAFTATLVDVLGTSAGTIDLGSPKNFTLAAIGDEDSFVVNRTFPFLMGRGQGVAVRVVRSNGVTSVSTTIRVLRVELDI